jgi:hypothetical protein
MRLKQSRKSLDDFTIYINETLEIIMSVISVCRNFFQPYGCGKFVKAVNIENPKRIHPKIVFDQVE